MMVRILSLIKSMPWKPSLLTSHWFYCVLVLWPLEEIAKNGNWFKSFKSDLGTGTERTKPSFKFRTHVITIFGILQQPLPKQYLCSYVDIVSGCMWVVCLVRVPLLHKVFLFIKGRFVIIILLVFYNNISLIASSTLARTPSISPSAPPSHVTPLHSKYAPTNF